MNPTSDRSNLSIMWGNRDSGSDRMSETEMEAHFQTQRKEYMAMKLARKK